MNRILCCVAVVALLAIACCSICSASWTVTAVDTGLVPTENPTTLVLDSSDRPHIGYRAGMNQVRHAYLEGPSWIKETVGSVRGESISLALDAAGHPGMSYMNMDNNGLGYAYRGSTGWALQTVFASPSGYTSDTSIVMDTTGRPHVSYEGPANGVIGYAYLQGSTWHTETVDTGIGVTHGTSIELDGDGRPHISYSRNMTQAYAHWTGSSWITETVDDSQITGDNSSLELDAAGRPHISYYDYTNSDLKYAYWDGSSWVRQVVDSVGRVGIYPSLALALDANGYPRISYYDIDNRHLKYARWNGSSWMIETVDAAGGQYTSLALDSQGRAHITYLGPSNTLKYAVEAVPEPSSLLMLGTGLLPLCGMAFRKRRS